MNTPVRWAVLALVLAALTGIGGCGGGGGGGGEGGGGPIPEATPERVEVADAVDGVLAAASAPETALRSYADTVATTLGGAFDPSAAGAEVVQSSLARFDTGAEWLALRAASDNAPAIVSAGVSPATGQALRDATVDRSAVSGKPSVHVYYINGIWSSCTDSTAAVTRLRDLLTTFTPPSTRTVPPSDFAITCDLLYNKTGIPQSSNWARSYGIGDALYWVPSGAALPLVKIRDAWLRAWKSVQWSVLGVVGQIVDFSEAVAQWASADVLTPAAQADVDRFAQSVRDDLALGRKVVLVSHSQGNFFAEGVLEALTSSQRKSVGVVAVASPADFPDRDSYGSFSHITLFNDIITLVAKSLPANTTNYLSRNSSSSYVERASVHSFVSSYLELESRAPLLTAILDAAQQLTTPPLPPTEVTNASGAAGDEFGSAVALSESFALIGAYGEGQDGAQSGAAYLYVRSGTTWGLNARLRPTDASAGRSFGWAVAVEPDHALVGAPFWPLGPTGGEGSVYVFSRSGATWSQATKLRASGGSLGNEFGIDVALSGDVAAVSATGGVFLFSRDVFGTWTQFQRIDLPNADSMSPRVALGGETLVIGVPSDGANVGVAYAYKRGFVGAQLVMGLTATLRPSDVASGDLFGAAVSTRGDVIVVGAPGASGSLGAAYAFTKTGSSWSQTKKFADPEGTVRQFGCSVAVTPALIAVGTDAAGGAGGGGGGGAPLVAATPSALAVHVFVLSGGTWAFQRTLSPGAAAGGPAFGRAIAANWMSLAIGRPNSSSGGGGTGILLGGSSPTLFAASRSGGPALTAASATDAGSVSLHGDAR